MTMRRKMWIVVADGAKASVYERPDPAEPISAIRHMSSSEARLRDRDLTSDRQGSVVGESGSGRHGLQPTTDPHRHLEHEFARAVIDYLDAELLKNSFNGLVVVAAPHMLGDLRELMSEGLRATVAKEIDKDLTHLDEFKLEKHLRQHEGV